jgi:hypothetical protein
VASSNRGSTRSSTAIGGDRRRSDVVCGHRLYAAGTLWTTGWSGGSMTTASVVETITQTHHDPSAVAPVFSTMIVD